jgi:hypothetical protein
MSVLDPLLTKEYVLLTAGETVAAARARLGDGPGVLYDRDGHPATVLRAADLAAEPPDAQLGDLLGHQPPLILVAVYSLDALLEHPAFDAVRLGASILVYDAVNPLTIVGIIEPAALGGVLAHYEPRPDVYEPPSGRHLTGPIHKRPLIIHCTPHNHRNELPYYNRLNPPLCQSADPEPHLIRPGG